VNKRDPEKKRKAPSSKKRKRVDDLDALLDEHEGINNSASTLVHLNSLLEHDMRNKKRVVTVPVRSGL